MAMTAHAPSLAAKAVAPATTQQAQLRRKCACGTHTSGGLCKHCSLAGQPLQRELAIGGATDPLETEAERIADRVLDSTAVETIQPPQSLHVMAISSYGYEHVLPVSVERTVAGAGAPLSLALRRDMQQQFGHDFSQVRVHADPAAAQSAHELRAEAYTIGPHIVFGAGRFTPETPRGKHLLAHELTHVLQQGAGSGMAVQRQPADAGVDAPASAPIDAGVVTAPSSDAGVPPVDAGTLPPAAPTRVPTNEAEAIEDTDKAFPDDASVTSAISGLPEVVQKELGTDIDYQRRFLSRMSLYLGPHPSTVNHFKGIDAFRFADGTRLDLHTDAISHLRDVQSVIGAKNMPSSGTGFALRDKIKAAVQTPGQMVHAVGYAIDFRAARNPHFKDARLVAVQALYKQSQTSFNIATGSWATRRSTIKKMGRGELAEDARERTDFITRFRAEGAKDVAGNELITHELSAADLAALKGLREEYKAYLLRRRNFQKALTSAKAKLKRGESLKVDPADIALAMLKPDLATERGRLLEEIMQVTSQRQSIIQRTRTILKGLIDKADADFQRMKQAPYVSDSEKDYAAKLDRLQKAKAAAQAAVASADRDLKKIRASLTQHTSVVDRVDKQLQAERNPARRACLEEKLRSEREARMAAISATQASASRRVRLGIDEGNADAALAEAKGASGKRLWLHQLEDLQRGLSLDDFDARLVFGIGSKDAEADKEVRDPSLVQLFSKGFFNVDPTPPPVTPAPTPAPASPVARKPAAPKPAPTPLRGFDLNFMEEMAKHGFDQGSEWTPGGVDSMHFEYAEGVDALHSPSDAVSSKAKKP